jgi:EAL domain-containing protein (putative c-di-GMP-specific phosphodiesterase class I)
MVQSTIALAHSLNRIVVAEGVESDEVLNALAEMKCDVAQGFIIGRPMSFNSLRRRLTVESRRSVA